MPEQVESSCAALAPIHVCARGGMHAGADRLGAICPWCLYWCCFCPPRLPLLLAAGQPTVSGCVPHSNRIVST